MLVTRGVGELTYDPAACPEPSVVVIVKPQVDPPPEAFERGVQVALVRIVRNHPGIGEPADQVEQPAEQRAGDAGSVQARRVRRRHAELPRRAGRVHARRTCSSSRDGAALTPPIDAGLLPGITREFLFEVGGEPGSRCAKQVLRDDDLFGADEAFLTSTTREIVPIVRVDDDDDRLRDGRAR